MPAVRGQQGGAGVARYRAVDGASNLRLVSLCTVLGAAVGSVGAAAVLLIGLVGFAAATVAFAVFEMLNAVHVERVLSGLFAAAVTPVALAAVSDAAGDQGGTGSSVDVCLAGGNFRVSVGADAGRCADTWIGRVWRCDGCLGADCGSGCNAACACRVAISFEIRNSTKSTVGRGTVQRPGVMRHAERAVPARMAK